MKATTILIIDDNAINRDFLVTLLGLSGYRVLQAVDGIDGLQRTRAEQPDLVIADILMPGMDGFDFVRQVRADAAIAQTRVVFYTAVYLAHETRLLAEQCGVEHFIVKPAEPETVLDTVAAALSARPPAALVPANGEFDREHLRVTTEKLAEKVAELDALSHRNELILNAAGEGIYGLDITGHVIFVNPAAVRMFGFAVEELMGKLLHDLIHHTKADGTPCLFQKCSMMEGLDAGVTRHGVDELFWRKDGTSFAVEYTSTPIREGVTVTGQVVVFKDITERKRAEEALRQSQALLRAVSEGTADMIFAKDRESRLLLANPATLRVLGKTAEEVMGKNAAEIYSDPEVARVILETDRRIMASGQAEAVEEIIETRNGRRVFLSTKAPRFDAEGRIIGLICVSRDISERVRAEEALRELNETLEKRVRERTQQAQALAAALNRAEEQERQRISQLLHDDLQQLLYSQLMRLELARRLLSTAEPATLTTHLDDLTDLANRALHITRNLVSEFRPLVFDAEDLELALRWLGGRMKLAYGLEVHLGVREACCLDDDEMLALVLRVVRELLFNVVKHAEVQEAHLALWQENGHIMVRVEDAGKGFDVEAARARHAAQGGMVLFSAAERMELLGGEMKVESAPGKGTQVTLIIPTEAPA